MRKHFGVSRTRWQIAQKLVLESWRDRNLAEEHKAGEARYLPLIKQVTDSLAEDASILEIGCGALCLTHALPQKNKTFLDPLIDDFRRMLPGELTDGEFLACTAEDVRKDNCSFDLIVCLNTIPHSLNPELIMNEIKRLLKKNGTLVLTINTHSGLEARLHYFAERWLPSLCRRTCPYFYTAHGIKKTLIRHFAIREDILIGEKLGWLPGFKRREHLFICSLADKTQGAGQETTATAT